MPTPSTNGVSHAAARRDEAPAGTLEQLDAVLQIVSIPAWTVLGLLMLLVAAFGVFGWMYRVPLKVEGRGIILAREPNSGDALRQATAPAAGRVTRILTRVGADVAVGDVLAELDQGELRDQLRRAEQEIERLGREDEALTRSEDEEAAARKQSAARLERSLRRSLELDSSRLIASRKIADVDRSLNARRMLSTNEALKSRTDADELESEIGRLDARLQALEHERIRDDATRDRDRLKRRLALQAATSHRDLLREQVERDSRIVSSHAGRVVDLMITPHAQVEKGAPAVLIGPGAAGAEAFDAIVFVPAGMGKRIRVNHGAEIVPDTVRRQERGFLRGIVRSVSEIPATEMAMQAELKHKTLVGSFLERYRGQALLSVHIDLPLDPSLGPGPAADRLTWSTRGGSPVGVSPGTLCAADVVVEERRLASLAFPWVKHLIGVD